MFGLEFALRLHGAQSVIASHWDVDATEAARFFVLYPFHRATS
jgi:hypothetical protein